MTNARDQLIQGRGELQVNFTFVRLLMIIG